MTVPERSTVSTPRSTLGHEIAAMPVRVAMSAWERFRISCGLAALSLPPTFWARLPSKAEYCAVALPS